MPGESADKPVIFVTGTLDFRGSTVHALNLGRALRAAGTRVHVVANGGRCEGAFVKAGLKLYVVESVGARLADVFILRRLLKSLEETRAVLVHVLSPNRLSLGLRIARHLDLPCLLTVHGARGEGQDSPLDPRLDAIVAVSEAVREDLVNRRRVPKERIRVIPNGVDLRVLPERLPFSSDRLPVVGTLGRLERVRGFDIFLDAVSRLLTEGVRAHFLIAGDGDELEVLSRHARRLGLAGHLTFAGEVQSSSQVFHVLDVFVLPSLREGLGQFLLEAMGSGIPVVASAVGGVYSVIEDGVNGLLVNRGDADALAGAIRRLVEDPEKAAAMGRAGRELVRREFSMEKVVEAHRDLYGEVQAARREAAEAGASR